MLRTGPFPITVADYLRSGVRSRWEHVLQLLSSAVISTQA